MDIARVRNRPIHTINIPHIIVTVGLPPDQNLSRMWAWLTSDVSLDHPALCVEIKLSGMTTEELTIRRNMYYANCRGIMYTAPPAHQLRPLTPGGRVTPNVQEVLDPALDLPEGAAGGLVADDAVQILGVANLEGVQRWGR